MRQFFPVAVLLAFAVTPNAAIAEPDLVPPLTDSTETPESVHVQPRGRAFAPKSSEDEAVQKQLTIANKRQRRLDANFDRKLTICRRC